MTHVVSVSICCRFDDCSQMYAKIWKTNSTFPYLFLANNNGFFTCTLVLALNGALLEVRMERGGTNAGNE